MEGKNNNLQNTPDVEMREGSEGSNGETEEEGEESEKSWEQIKEDLDDLDDVDKTMPEEETSEEQSEDSDVEMIEASEEGSDEEESDGKSDRENEEPPISTLQELIDFATNLEPKRAIGMWKTCDAFLDNKNLQTQYKLLTNKINSLDEITNDLCDYLTKHDEIVFKDINNEKDLQKKINNNKNLSKFIREFNMHSKKAQIIKKQLCANLDIHIKIKELYEKLAPQQLKYNKKCIKYTTKISTLTEKFNTFYIRTVEDLRYIFEAYKMNYQRLHPSIKNTCGQFSFPFGSWDGDYEGPDI
jgi:ribosomal protein S15P/S13E